MSQNNQSRNSTPWGWILVVFLGVSALASMPNQTKIENGKPVVNADPAHEVVTQEATMTAMEKGDKEALEKTKEQAKAQAEQAKKVEVAIDTYLSEKK